MRWSSWSNLGAAVVLIGDSYVEASLFPRAKSGDGYISVPVGTVDRPRSEAEKRQTGSIVTELENRIYFYATTIAIGTPPQEVTILVDTGSSELWVNPQCDNVQSAVQEKQCEDFGEYDSSKSRSASRSSMPPQKLRYGDASDSSTHTSATLDYIVDTITFGNSDITNQTFGMVSESEGIAQGIIGLAPDTESGFDSNEPYTLVLSNMAAQGVINSRVFSLDLRHSESLTGAVIYGGLDRNKFIGELQEVDIIRGVDRSWRLAVTLTSLGITIDSPEEFDLADDDTNVILDSGTTLSRLHYSTAYPVLKALNAQADAEGYYYTQCSYRDTAGSVDFGFGDKIIKVPFSDFILDMGNDRFCYVGIAITTSQQILGDSVLRAGYFVFDWDNQKVHIAQAANCGDDDIVAVKSGSDAVPSVTGNCKEGDAAPTGTSGRPQSSAADTLPTSAYTTVYTVTDCPLFDFGCTTGMVTTQTVGPAKNTVTVTAAPGSGSGSGDSAAMHPMAMTWIFVVIGAFTVGYNLI